MERRDGAEATRARGARTSVLCEGSTWRGCASWRMSTGVHTDRACCSPYKGRENLLEGSGTTCGAGILRLQAAVPNACRPCPTHMDSGHSGHNGHYQPLTTCGAFIRGEKPQHLKSCFGSLTDKCFRTNRYEKTNVYELSSKC